jgi:hypothetical protein
MFQEHPSVDYLANPTPAGLQRVRTDFTKARRLGANSLRLFLELPVFMHGPGRVRQEQLDALRRVLTAAENRRLYPTSQAPSTGTSSPPPTGTTS